MKQSLAWSTKPWNGMCSLPLLKPLQSLPHFDFWMSWNKFNTFVLVVNYINKQWELCHFIVDIFEVHNILRTTMAIQLKELFVFYLLCDKVVAYMWKIVVTLALGSRPMQAFAKVRAKKADHECGRMWEWTLTLPNELPFWELESRWILKTSESDYKGQNPFPW
jgi:hypothetical protein